MDLDRLITSGTKEEIQARSLMGDYLTVIKDGGDGLIYLLQLVPKPNCVLRDFEQYHIILLDITKIKKFVPVGYATNYGYQVLHWEYEDTEIYDSPIPMTEEQLNYFLDKYGSRKGENN